MPPLKQVQQEHLPLTALDTPDLPCCYYKRDVLKSLFESV